MSTIARGAVAGFALIALASCATTGDAGPPAEPDPEMGYVLASLGKEGTSFEMTLLLTGEENRFLPFSKDEGLRLFEVAPGSYRVAAVVRDRTGYDISSDPRLAKPLFVEADTIVYLGEWLVRSDPQRGRLAVDFIRNYASHHLARVDDTFPAFAGLEREAYFAGEEDIRLGSLAPGEIAFRTQTRSENEQLPVAPVSQALATVDLLASFGLIGELSAEERAELTRRFFGSVPATTPPTPLIAEVAIGGYLDDGRPLRLFLRLGPHDASAPYDQATTAMTVGTNAVGMRDGNGPSTRRAVKTQMGFVDAHEMTWVVFGNGTLVPLNVLEAQEQAEAALRSETASPEDALDAAGVILRDQSRDNDQLAATLLSRLEEGRDLPPHVRARALLQGAIFHMAADDLDAASALLDRLGTLETSEAVDRIEAHGRAFVRLTRDVGDL